ncbi:hypothetical protein B9Z55_007297 [Caenorhabditis nigoni]|uniref:Uncharacterized protein n=1 Tax=Caenorhabditis nigoni TaxID=1611254 RepID=A0A2G5V8Z1_9PELO|nr:hypothetical protein B9Z55_007297 [Caenorhabditis nigoni]
MRYLQFICLEKWATTTIKSVEKLIGEALAEKDRQAHASNLQITTLEQTIRDQTALLVRMDEALKQIPAFEEQLETSEQQIDFDRGNFNNAKKQWILNDKKKDERINELESTVKTLVEEKTTHLARIATLNEQWKGAARQTIQDRIEFGEKTKVSEDETRKLKEKLVRLENELVARREEIREVSEANVKVKIDLKKLRLGHEQEVGKIQREVERLQRLLIDVEEANDTMKNAIKTLEEEKKSQSQESKLEIIDLQQTITNLEVKTKDLNEQVRQEKETMATEFSKTKAAMVNELSQKEAIIVDLSSKINESETKIKNVSKDYEEKMAKLRVELKNQKTLLEEQRVLEAQRNKEAEREKSLMKQTIKDLSTALESMRRDQKWIPMMEEQLEDADKQLDSEKAARKLDSEAKAAEIAKFNEAYQTELNRLQQQYDQEQQDLRNQLNSKETARSQSEEEKATLMRELNKTKNELLAKEYKVKILIEHVDKEAMATANRYAKFHNMLKRNHGGSDEEQDPAKKRALERSDTS